MQSLADIDWTTWTPTDRATLIFVIEPERVLLIRKKRGLGAGKMNAPGGRIEPNETHLEGALRELGEELGVTATGAREYGELAFQFSDGYGLLCYVFRADACVGQPVETDEATPHWCALDALPFDEMWADDRLWIPLLLAHKTFRGRFIFDREVMLDHHIEVPHPEHEHPLF